MRDLKLLFEILIDSLKKGWKKYYCNDGICGEIYNLRNCDIINACEAYLLDLHIRRNKPHAYLHKEFTENVYWTGRTYWWTIMDGCPEAREIRIEFLTKLKDSL